MIPRAVVERLAEVAHELWRHQMIENGWHYAVSYDAGARCHDALVPFEKLGPVDRREALLAARALAPTVVAQLDYARGDDREFTADDIAEGQLVTLSAGGHFEGHDVPPTGRIIAWEPDDEEAPFLKCVRVRWSTGDVTEHPPALRELRRLSALPGRS